jgi:hypothetical protein
MLALRALENTTRNQKLDVLPLNIRLPKQNSYCLSFSCLSTRAPGCSALGQSVTGKVLDARQAAVNLSANVACDI